MAIFRHLFRRVKNVHKDANKEHETTSKVRLTTQEPLNPDEQKSRPAAESARHTSYTTILEGVVAPKSAAPTEEAVGEPYREVPILVCYGSFPWESGSEDSFQDYCYLKMPYDMTPLCSTNDPKWDNEKRSKFASLIQDFELSIFQRQLAWPCFQCKWEATKLYRRCHLFTQTVVDDDQLLQSVILDDALPICQAGGACENVAARLTDNEQRYNKLCQMWEWKLARPIANTPPGLIDTGVNDALKASLKGNVSARGRWWNEKQRERVHREENAAKARQNVAVAHENVFERVREVLPKENVATEKSTKGRGL